MPIDVDVPLIDHHCHGLVPRNLTRREFEKLISESFVDAPPAPATSMRRSASPSAPTARRSSASSPSPNPTPISSAAPPRSARPRSTSSS
jgi:hypothetical protein